MSTGSVGGSNKICNAFMNFIGKMTGAVKKDKAMKNDNNNIGDNKNIGGGSSSSAKPNPTIIAQGAVLSKASAPESKKDWEAKLVSDFGADDKPLADFKAKLKEANLPSLNEFTDNITDETDNEKIRDKYDFANQKLTELHNIGGFHSGNCNEASSELKQELQGIVKHLKKEMNERYMD